MISSAVATVGWTFYNPKNCDGAIISGTITAVDVTALNLGLTSIFPDTGCINTIGKLTTITGRFAMFLKPDGNFSFPRVFFGSSKAEVSRCKQSTAVGSSSIVFNCTELEVVIPFTQTLGAVDITVGTPSDCSSAPSTTFTLPNAFTYFVSNIFVLYADPQVVSNLAPFQITIYTSGLIEATTGVWLLNDAKEKVYTLNFTVVGNSYNKFVAVIPAGSFLKKKMTIIYRKKS